MTVFNKENSKTNFSHLDPFTKSPKRLYCMPCKMSNPLCCPERHSPYRADILPPQATLCPPFL